MLKPNISATIAVFLVVGILADLVPHPALGPGLIQSSFTAIFAQDPASDRSKSPNLTGSADPIQEFVQESVQ